ncbi:tetratricopeptide repeat protein [Adhaeribacter terreus]|uniref:histidine kinase n=1 Tax=Adhaeribacter terreus TaxID=529703 RepID=A0ABW0EC87_9BACT
MLYCRLAENYFRIDPQEALAASKKAEEIARQLNMPLVRARALNTMGVANLILSDFDQAINSHYNALRIRKQMNDSLGMANSMLNIGNVYYKLNNPEKCLENYHNALAIATKLKDLKALSKIYNNIGSVYESEEDYANALAYFEKSIKMKEQLQDLNGLAVSLFHTGRVFILTNQTEKGLAYMHKALALEIQTSNNVSRVVTLRGLSEVYQSLNNFKQALKFAQQGYELAKTIQSKSEIMFALERLQEVYRASNDYEKAYKYLSLAAVYSDSLNNEQSLAQRNELEIKYDTQQKQLENLKLLSEKSIREKEFERRNLVQVLVILIAVLLFILALAFYFSWRRTKSNNKKLVEINGQIQLRNQEIQRQREELSGKSELLLKQRNELEKLNDFKNRIFSIIGHDLRSPFASLKNLFLIAQTSKMTESEIRTFFRLLDEKCDFANNLLDNVFLWASSQLSGLVINLEPIQVSDLVDENIRLLETAIEQKDLRITNNISDTILPLTEKERLNFVLRNLISNAVKFSYPGDAINIDAIETDYEIIISVTDSGQGIANEHLGKLFTAQRFTTNGTNNEKGTGLGLLLCKELLESINGKLSVQSQLGVGTTFTVKLPNKVTADKPVKMETHPALV